MRRTAARHEGLVTRVAPVRGHTGTVELVVASRAEVSLKDQQWTLRVVPGRLAAMSSGWGDEIETLRGNDVRLRRAELEEYEQVALPWYQDAEVLQLSDLNSIVNVSMCMTAPALQRKSMPRMPPISSP